MTEVCGIPKNHKYKFQQYRRKKTMVDWIKARVAERTSWDGATIIAMSVMVIIATPIVELLAWPALIYGIWTLYNGE